MMLASILLLPRLLGAGAEPADAVKLPAPRVQYRMNVATATTSPWIDANGWRLVRTPGQSFVYHVTGDSAALAAAEAFTYGCDALVATDAAGAEFFGRMLDFLRQIPTVDLPPVADVGVVDDNSAATGELMNLLSRQNLLYKPQHAIDRRMRLNVHLGTKDYPFEDANDPSMLAHKIRAKLGDDNRSLRVYGSEVVIARLLASGDQARVYLLNYSNRPVRGLRVRIRGSYAKGESRVFGVADAHVSDLALDPTGTEFTIPELNAFAVIDLSR
jgi:hypothetical protein